MSEPAELEPEAGLLFSRYQAVPWLARTHAVTVLPSVASLESLESLRKLPPGNPERRALLAFADPFFSEAQAAGADKLVQVAALAGRGAPSARTQPARLRRAPVTRLVDSATLALLPRLPDTADEVLSVAAALNVDLERDIFTGRRATERAVKTMDLSGYKVVVFATHGLLPGDLDGLTQPALALSSPIFDGSDEDGLLTMGEILSLRLDADWVVLSACNTAAGHGAGAEAFTGLGQAFFYAGTRAVLLSNWSVESVSAKLLTTDQFRRQAADPTLSRAGALRQSMLALIDGPGSIDPDTGQAVFSYAHPLF